jgi:hypothetical protein
MAKERIYVVSYNYDEFKRYRDTKALEYMGGSRIDKMEEFPDYVYVSNIDHLRGQRNIKGFYVGRFEEREDIDEIRAIVNTSKVMSAIPKSDWWVYVNGALQKEGYDYAIRNTTGEDILHFTTTPVRGSTIQFTDENGNSKYDVGDGLQRVWNLDE